jgi:uncharacterized protein YabN with tetrapyrrole methylase and pyrophosphatase domain
MRGIKQEIHGFSLASVIDYLFEENGCNPFDKEQVINHLQNENLERSVLGVLLADCDEQWHDFE